MKFPLLKDDDDLDNLLNDMLGPEAAKKVMYGSEHASHAHGESEAKQISVIGASTLDSQTRDGANDKHEIMSAAPGGGAGKRSIKSRSSLKDKDMLTVQAGHGSEAGKAPGKKIKWNSTKHQSVARAQ